MEQQIQASGSQSNLWWQKTSLVLNWIFGIFFAIDTIFEIVDYSYSSITFFLCTAITLPPIYNYLKKKFNFTLSGWLKIIIIFALLVFSLFILNFEI
ncbi:MAG: hypothetical protein M1155_01185 [Patescibacteria group bacterium]|nr:hypothetical protein [Patescibacteria group bacterium]